MAKNTNRDSPKFMLRLPDGMRDSISTAATTNNRSMNAEIVARLELSFDERKIDGHIAELSAVLKAVLPQLERVAKLEDVDPPKKRRSPKPKQPK